MITEGSIRLALPKAAKISKDLDVFYNPAMKLNRDITLLVLKGLYKQLKRPLNIGSPLEGSGVRIARILKELPADHIDCIHANDYDKTAVATIKKTLTLNKLSTSKVTLHNTDASLFLLNSEGFDYIDIDPFGSPNHFLDAACKRIARDGILAVTATDTPALCGTYPETCKRKYDAHSYRTPFMHELALRILIRKVQVIAAQYEKAAIPVLSYAQLHYVRIFFIVKKGRQLAESLIKKHQSIDYDIDTGEWKTGPGDHQLIGPLYAGAIQDTKFLQSLEKHPLIDQLIEESSIDTVGFYNIPYFCKKFKLQIQPLAAYLKALDGTRTHCDGQGIKTLKKYPEVMKMIKKISQK